MNPLILAIRPGTPEAGPDVNASIIKGIFRDWPWVPYVFWGLAVFLALSTVAKTWVASPAAPLARKFVWTVLLLIPYLGWVFWVAFFKMPKRHGIRQRPWSGGH